MKRITYLKTLLVGLCAMGATSAWADATSIYERGTTNAWSEADLAEWVLSGTAESSIVENGIKFAKTAVARTEYTYTKSISTSDNAIVTMDLQWIVENANGSATAGCYLVFGDVRLFWCGQNRDLKITIGGNETSLISGGSTNLRGTTFNVNLSIDKASKNVSYSISNSSYNSGTPIEGTGAVNSSDITSVAFGWSRGGQQNVSSQIIKSISISEERQTVATANYTINYKLGEAIVKTVSSSSVVGNSISAQMAIDGEGDYADNHYLITSEDVPTMVLKTGDNVLNVPVRAPYTGTLNVTTTIGNTEPIVNTINLVESDAKVCAWSYAYPLYVKSGNVYYLADNTETFGESGTFKDGEVINKSVSYSNSDEHVVFFAEAESNSGTDFVYSNGRSGYVGAQNARDRGISVGTLPAGDYELIVKITAANKRSLGIRQSTNDHIVSVGTSNDDLSTGIKSALFTLDEETASLYINGANSGEVKTNQSEDFDYVLVKSSKEIVRATIGSNGYTTFACPSNVKIPTGVKAYTAKVNEAGTYVNFTEITSGIIPANNGVLLEGTAGEISLEVVSEATELGENDFKVGKGAALAAAENTTYFAMEKGSSPLAFGKIAATVAVPANKAYLAVVAATEPEARLTVTFDGETTAIKSIENAETSNAIYNLNGQRVEKAQKGLYIVNGKKTIVK